MGVEYWLYETKSKQFIWLGKSLSTRNGFQLSADVIAAFLCDNRDGEFEMHDDCGNLPDEDDDDKSERDQWKRRANWWSKTLDDLSEQGG